MAIGYRQFLADLPSTVVCESCLRTSVNVEWRVSSVRDLEWFAVGFAKCERCSWLKIAAAGTTDQAKSQADQVRVRFMVALGL